MNLITVITKGVCIPVRSFHVGEIVCYDPGQRDGVWMITSTKEYELDGVKVIDCIDMVRGKITPQPAETKVHKVHQLFLEIC